MFFKGSIEDTSLDFKNLIDLDDLIKELESHLSTAAFYPSKEDSTSTFSYTNDTTMDIMSTDTITDEPFDGTIATTLQPTEALNKSTKLDWYNTFNWTIVAPSGRHRALCFSKAS